MAISAATSGKSRIVVSNVGNTGKSLFERGKVLLSSSTTYKQGDLLCIDSTSHAVRLVAATGDAATFLGIADEYVTNGILKSPYTTDVSSAVAQTEVRGPIFGVTAKMKLNSGDAFTVGCKVYLCDTTDTQTVSVTNPGDANYIGVFCDAAVTAASGSEGLVYILARYPTVLA